MLYLIFILWDWCCGFMDVDCYRDRLGDVMWTKVEISEIFERKTCSNIPESYPKPQSLNEMLIPLNH